jgi:protein gp37
MPSAADAPAWYDATWNPIAGCSPVGPGCDHCTAVRIAAQLARTSGKSGARYAGLTAGTGAALRWSGEVHEREEVRVWPLHQRKPRRILVGSLSDLFHERLDNEAVDAVHAAIAIAEWHRFLVLTRRAERMRAYYADPQTPNRVAALIARLAAEARPARRSAMRIGNGRVRPAEPTGLATHNALAAAARASVRDAGVAGAKPFAGKRIRWPLPNLYLGVAVEDQERADRIAALLQTPAVLRWACFEPLLGPVQPGIVPFAAGGYVDALSGRRFATDPRGRPLLLAEPALPPLDWVVAGGETGAAARPTILNWVRDLRDACIGAGAPFFFKRWGEWGPAPDDDTGETVVRLGRGAANRLVDGRTWDELPPALDERARPRR